MDKNEMTNPELVVRSIRIHDTLLIPFDGVRADFPQFEDFIAKCTEMGCAATYDDGTFFVERLEPRPETPDQKELVAQILALPVGDQLAADQAHTDATVEGWYSTVKYLGEDLGCDVSESEGKYLLAGWDHMTFRSDLER